MKMIVEEAENELEFEEWEWSAQTLENVFLFW